MTKRADQRTNVADVMLATLKASGVRLVYGLPGDSINGFTDALRRDGEVVWEHVRHEEAGAFAAAGEAAMTGQLGVCAASCGPGNRRPSRTKRLGADGVIASGQRPSTAASPRPATRRGCGSSCKAVLGGAPLEGASWPPEAGYTVSAR
jgi:hypothetical protein